MKLFIPTLGTELVLSKPWSFDLYPESRNELAFIHFDQEMKRGRWTKGYGSKWIEPDPTRVMLPAGTKMKVDRIYIRKGLDDFDSITFVLPEIKAVGKTGSNARRPVRFWVKLADANTIEFDESQLKGESQ